MVLVWDLHSWYLCSSFNQVDRLQLLDLFLTLIFSVKKSIPYYRCESGKLNFAQIASDFNYLCTYISISYKQTALNNILNDFLSLIPCSFWVTIGNCTTTLQEFCNLSHCTSLTHFSNADTSFITVTTSVYKQNDCLTDIPSICYIVNKTKPKRLGNYKEIGFILNFKFLRCVLNTKRVYFWNEKQCFI